MLRFQEKYTQEIIPALKKKYADRNVMSLPKLKKIIVCMGIAEASKDKSAMQSHINELALLSGQKAVITKAKKAISNFKLRENQPIGLMVTLRGKRMYDFIDRFCNIVSPRIRDFRGFKVTGDTRGNFTIGLTDQQVFPEIKLDDVVRTQGMHITFVTSAANDEESFELMRLLGFPFK